jgi:hypothetical protein
MTNQQTDPSPLLHNLTRGQIDHGSIFFNPQALASSEEDDDSVEQSDVTHL